MRTYIYPALGKINEARAIAEAFVKMRQGKGKRESLQVQLFGQSPVLVAIGLYDTLADYEQTRKANAADPEWQEAAKKLTELSDMAANLEIFEFIVPPKM